MLCRLGCSILIIMEENKSMFKDFDFDYFFVKRKELEFMDPLMLLLRPN